MKSLLRAINKSEIACANRKMVFSFSLNNESLFDKWGERNILYIFYNNFQYSKRNTQLYF